MLLLKRKTSPKGLSHKTNLNSLLPSIVYLPLLLIGMGIETAITMITERIWEWILACLSLVPLLLFGWHLSLADMLHDGEVLGGYIAIGLSVMAILKRGIGGGMHSKVEAHHMGKRNHTDHTQQEEEIP